LETELFIVSFGGAKRRLNRVVNERPERAANRPTDVYSEEVAERDGRALRIVIPEGASEAW